MVRPRWPGICGTRRMLTNKPAHLKQFDYTGFHRYSLTFCTNRRRAIFTNENVVDLVLLQISRAAAEREFAVITYCFMHDHLHLLVHGQSEASECKGFISKAKQYSGYYYSKEFPGRLWQRYGYERTLRKDEDTLTVARYILENPVRGKLVANVQDYPFLGSLVCGLEDLMLSVYSGVDSTQRSG
jgi:REP-associated tyrosine transposase